MSTILRIFTTFFLIVISAVPLQSCSEKKIFGDPVPVDSAGKTVKTRYKLPDGFKRIESAEDSFGEYLRNLPLKPEGTRALNYDGSVKQPDDVYDGVVDIDVGDKDLQQCADAIMRLRAEYLFAQGRFDEIKFNFTNGFPAEYSKWRNGYRISVKGNKVNWVKKYDNSESYQEFREYLDIVFMYAGTLSLSKELHDIELNDMSIGDIFIKGGSPGHAVLVVDMAENKNTGERIFLLAQSYMPAQDIQILKNPIDNSLSPWYSASFSGKIQTPEWTFRDSELKKF